MGGRARLQVILVALAAAATMAAAGFGLEAVALPRPGRGLLVAAGAVAALDQFRFARTVEDVDGRRLRGTCYEGWFRGGGTRRPVEGAATVFRGRGAVVAAGARVWTFGRDSLGRRVAATALRLACPKVLGGVLARTLIRGRVGVARARVDGQSAYAIGFRVRHEHVWFFVGRPRLRPIAIRVLGHGVTGIADVEVGAPKPQIRHVLEILRVDRRRHAVPA